MSDRRKILAQGVALSAQEAGFEKADKAALDLLTEMFQSLIVEIGRTTRVYTELGGRVEPCVGDLSMALIELGLKIDPVGLRAFSRRSTKPVIGHPLLLQVPKVPSILSAGKKRNLPPYIPDHFPSMPDPHAYIRTPTHKEPLQDYAACREKTSQHKRDLDRSLTKFIARTSPCFYIFPENQSLFPLILPKPSTYIEAVKPRDQIFEEDDNSTPLNFIKKEKEAAEEKLNDGEDEDGDTDKPDANSKSSADDNASAKKKKKEKEVSWELIDNPYLRNVRPFKRGHGSGSGKKAGAGG